ncbi:hypothetical protein OOU_Y34scaffold00119g5 [Pyricularia oryzae Y34]|uniref:Uncharacterized protein n=2 Tax=Pyricularia oryzae TaxID=318829 RepID=A0AA97PR83_PYRO3|nr:hypothetical protein OOU_Y34scaffold00119g5 [Pyricularia oryzae Y34]
MYLSWLRQTRTITLGKQGKGHGALLN